jgi:hypothetical protein
MRKVQFLAVFWTLVIAIPLTALALSLAAFLTDHLVDIVASMVAFGRATTVGGRGWIMEISERWPEVDGMIVGQIVILLILLLVRREKMAEQNHSN